MNNSSHLLSFLNEIENDVTSDTQPTAGNSAEFRETAFTRIIAEALETAGILESPMVYHCEIGTGAVMIKANGYSVPDDDSRLDLFVTLYKPIPHTEMPTINSAEIDTAFNRLERFLGKSLNGLHEGIDPSWPERHMPARIYDLKGKFDRVNFLLFTNCKLAVRCDKVRKQNVHGTLATYDVWHIERFRRLRESGAGYEALNVDLKTQPGGGLPCVRLDTNHEGYRTCVAIFPGALLRDLYDEHGSRLLELNVRSYLQAKGKINKGILETIRNSPADFMAYNNGITVVAEKIVFGKLDNGDDGILSLEGMQIVNGGQTTASIHRASKEFGANLSEVFVQGKIVTVEPERFNEVVPFISRYANSQNKVTDPDLQANHRFHIGLERVSKREWAPGQTSKWFYERARGSYQTMRTHEGTTEARLRLFDKTYPTCQRFSKEDLAKFENCWRGLPNIVNRGGQKNFTQFMTLIKTELGELPDKWEPSSDEFKRYIGKAILFRDVQNIVKADNSITAYRINITTYTVSLLAEKTARRIDLDAIWKRQSISPALEEMVRLWAVEIFTALIEYSQSQTVHIDNILKSSDTFDYLLSLKLKIPKVVENELVSSIGTDSSAPDGLNGQQRASDFSNQDHNNVARCKELNAGQWMSIVKWGKDRGEFKEWQLGIATTLASYATLDWRRTPSPKQAKHGADMIEAIREAGVSL
jgi:hypothetical protein